MASQSNQLQNQQHQNRKGNGNNNAYPSICIPRVFSNITWKQVKDVFEELKLGRIDRVDMIKKENEKGEKFQRVFVHFKFWNNRNDNAKKVRSKLLNGDEVKIVYDDPWFWKISKSKVARPQPKRNQPHKNQPHKKPRVLTDEEQEKGNQISQLKKQLEEQQKMIETLQLKINVSQEDNPDSDRPQSPSSPQSPPFQPQTPTTPAYTGGMTPEYSVCVDKDGNEIELEAYQFVKQTE